MDKFSSKIFNDFSHDKYHLKFRDMYFNLYDYLVDNKINIYICIDEYNDPFFGDFLENYDEKEPYISTLVVSLFCSLQATSNLASFNKDKSIMVSLNQSLSHKAKPVLKEPGTNFQKELPALFLKNLTKILDSKYRHKSYCTIYDRIKNNFREKLEDIQIKNKIAQTTNMITQKEQDFVTIQKIIHNLMNDLFNTNDYINDWTSIGFYAFNLSIESNPTKEYFIKKYLTHLVEFNTTNLNNIYYSKGLYRNEFTF
jgi:hypothetical protein